MFIPGLSATCTPDVITNICNNLGIHNPTRFVGDTINETTLHQPGYVQPVLTPLPSHLTISASMDDKKDEALLKLLTRKPFNQLTGGILIYCATREETEHLASYIRTALQDKVDQVIYFFALLPYTMHTTDCHLLFLVMTT